MIESFKWAALEHDSQDTGILLTKEKMQNLFESLAKDDANRLSIEANAKAMAATDAKEKIADIVLSLIK